MKLYVIAHKPFAPPPLSEIYQPLFVGAAQGAAVPAGYLRDDAGENISAKNPYYCELTGLYWIWKHSTEEVVGLCHYRRYFVTGAGKAANLLFHRREGFLTEAEITAMLRKADVVRHNPTFFPAGVRRHYTDHHDPATLAAVEEILRGGDPRYLAAYQKVMNGKTAHLLNMMILPKPLLDEYCTWLFGLLFQLEKRISLDDTNRRLMGYLAERLLDVWIAGRGLHAADCFTVNTERTDYMPF